MKKLTAAQQLKKRKDDAYEALRKIVNKKITENATNTYHILGITLGVTGQTVYNYTKGKGNDGFFVEALIEQIELL